MLSFETERGVLPIDLSRFSSGIQGIRGVQLHAGFSCGDFKYTARRGLNDSSCRNQSSALTLDHIVVIVPRRLFELFVAVVDSWPILVAVRKSNGVPSTGAMTPVAK
jgi:hypothetical protein